MMTLIIRVVRYDLRERKYSINLTLLEGLRADPTPTALLRSWYTLVREKRTTRMEWLKSLVKSTDIDIGSGDGCISQVRFSG